MNKKFEILHFSMYIKMKIRAMIIRIGCLFDKQWHYLNYHCICTTAKVLKSNNIYTYQDHDTVDKVKFLDYSIEKGYLFCTLFFFDQMKTITVCQILQPNASVFWRLLDEEEYDEIIFKQIDDELTKNYDLLELDYE
jgi:hypothetical protein